jgi:hypothetical protein
MKEPQITITYLAIKECPIASNNLATENAKWLAII